PPFDIAIALAGPPSSTAKMVAGVAALGGRLPAIANALHETIGDVATEGAHALQAGNLDRVGELMNINHGLLCALGVSTIDLDTACEVARSCGALGAKLTGAGGGGCVVALAHDEELDAILNTWNQRGWPSFRATINDNS
ncbi:MAG: mevalonate kinase, partial [Bradymonadaceae bacterium]